MVAWEVVFSKQAAKDAKKITQTGLRTNVEKLLCILRENPFKNQKAEDIIKIINDIFEKKN